MFPIISKVLSLLAATIKNLLWLWLFILVTLLVVALWFYAPSLNINGRSPFGSPLLRCVISLFGYFIWGFLFFRSQLKSFKKNHNPNEPNENELTIGKGISKKNPKGELDDETLQLREEYKKIKGIEKILNSKSNPGFIVLGNDSSGKTTLMKHTGIHFSPQYQLTSLNRLQTWWFSKRGFFAEFKFDQEVSEWENKLLLLKQHINTQRLKGLLFTLSIPDLLSDSPAKLHEQGKKLKDYVQVYQNTMGLEIPVYLILTHCENIMGFDEFTRNLDESQAMQPLGLHFEKHELDAVDDGFQKVLQSKVSQIMQRLYTNILPRLQNQNSTEDRLKIYQLPDQINVVSIKLAYFLKGALGVDYDQTPLHLRGIFYCGIAQSDRLYNANLLTSYDMYLSIKVDQMELEGHSRITRGFFIADLFDRLINQEVVLAQLTSKKQRRVSLLQSAVYAGSGFFVVIVASLWIYASYLNKQQWNKFSEAVNMYQKYSAKNYNPGKQNFDILTRAQSLTGFFNTKNSSYAMHWGLYLNGGSQDKVDNYFVQLSHQMLISKVQKAIYDLMPNQSTVQLYQSLKAYIMILNPKVRDAKSLMYWVDNHWEQISFLLNKSGGSYNKAKVQNAFYRYLNLSTQPLPYDQPEILKAQEQLSHQDINKLNYLDYQTTMVARAPDGLSFDDGDIQNFTSVFKNNNTKMIPEFYTASGFVDLFHPFFKNPYKYFHTWVIGRDNIKLNGSLKALQKNYFNAYLSDYVAAWKDYLSNITLVKFYDLKGVQNAIKVLASSQKSPLLVIVSQVHKNIHPLLNGRHNLLDSELIFQDMLDQYKTLAYIGNITRPKVGFGLHSFSKGKLPHHLNTTYNKLTALLIATNNYINLILKSNDPDKVAYDNEKKQFLNPNAPSPIQDLVNFSDTLPAPLSSWVFNLCAQSKQLMLDASLRYLDRLWDAQVYSYYTTNLADRYPLSFNNNQSAHIDVFSKFFGPQGVLTQFSAKFLKPFIDTSGEKWQPKIIQGSKLKLSTTTLEQLQLAYKVNQSLFPQGSVVASLSISLKPTFLSSNTLAANLVSNNQSIMYQHGPQVASTISWPKKQGNENSFASLNFVGVHSTHRYQTSGPWAIFKLLDQGKLSFESTSQSYKITYFLNKNEVIYNVSTDASVDLIALSGLRHYQLNKNL